MDIPYSYRPEIKFCPECGQAVKYDPEPVRVALKFGKNPELRYLRLDEFIKYIAERIELPENKINNCVNINVDGKEFADDEP